jgi:predicted dehydrogenase
MYPNGIGKQNPADPPKDFDWDMWLGPRAYRPYQYNIAPYYFRWWKDYSTQMGNWGVHYMDAIRWMVGETAPKAITATGGKYVLEDDRDIPDTMEVLFEFESGMMINFGIHEASMAAGVQGGEIELCGTKGIIAINQNGYNIKPARPGQFQEWKQLVEAESKKFDAKKTYGDLNISENSTGLLIRNFLDCIKSRETPWCTLEEGHRSTSFAHLANISLEVGQRIEWDAEKEVITNNKKANDLLQYEYRAPWKNV